MELPLFINKRKLLSTISTAYHCRKHPPLLLAAVTIFQEGQSPLASCFARVSNSLAFFCSKWRASYHSRVSVELGDYSSSHLEETVLIWTSRCHEHEFPIFYCQARKIHCLQILIGLTPASTNSALRFGQIFVLKGYYCASAIDLVCANAMGIDSGS